MSKRDCVPIAAVVIFSLLCGGCRKGSGTHSETSINSSQLVSPGLAQLHGDDQNSAPDGVLTKPGMKPFTWPECLTSLPFGKEVRYRNTDTFVAVVSEGVLGDKETFIHVTRGQERIGRIWLPGAGQSGIIDVDTPMPVIESWSTRYDGLYCRSLLVPMRDGSRVHYGGCYTEVYTPNRNHALVPKAYEVQLQPNAKIMTVYFLGCLKPTTAANAEQGLKDAHTIQ
jgi:hypothetical protein